MESLGIPSLSILSTWFLIRPILHKELVGIVTKYGFEFSLKGLEKYSETGRAPVKSRSLDASLFLDSYGNVFPSIMWNKKIGNIRDVEYDLSRLWNNADAEMARSDIKEGKDPENWTACEAYQSIIGDIFHTLL